MNFVRGTDALDVDEADGGIEQQPDLLEHGSREMGSRDETAGAVTEAEFEQQPDLLEHRSEMIAVPDIFCGTSLASNTVADKPAGRQFIFVFAPDAAHKQELPDLASGVTVE